MLQQGNQPSLSAFGSELTGIATGVVVWLPGLVAAATVDFLSSLLQIEAKSLPLQQPVQKTKTSAAIAPELSGLG